MEGMVHKWIEVRVSEVVLRFQKKGLVNYGQNILGFLEENFKNKYSGVPRDIKAHTNIVTVTY